ERKEADGASASSPSGDRCGARPQGDTDMGKQLTPRGRQRRDQLIADATARFADRVYHDTSVAELVSGLGVGKGVFYWYFESKEQLFVEILREEQLDLRRAHTGPDRGGHGPGA